MKFTAGWHGLASLAGVSAPTAALVREDARLREQEFGNYQKGDHMTKSFAERR
ncbi:hypothetical protein T484DRAFT_1798291, partial [Baffinella frigidus]